MRRNVKKLICFLLLVAMLLLLTACSITDVKSNIVKAILQLKNVITMNVEPAASEEPEQTTAPTSAPTAKPAPVPRPEEDELPWLPV